MNSLKVRVETIGSGRSVEFDPLREFILTQYCEQGNVTFVFLERVEPITWEELTASENGDDVDIHSTEPLRSNDVEPEHVEAKNAWE